MSYTLKINFNTSTHKNDINKPQNYKKVNIIIRYCNIVMFWT